VKGERREEADGAVGGGRSVGNDGDGGSGASRRRVLDAVAVPREHWTVAGVDHFRRTMSYAAQIGYVWKTAEQTIMPQRRSINVNVSSLFDLAELAQDVSCDVGVNEILTGSGDIVRRCDQDLSAMADASLPTINFVVPGQDVEVPASQRWTAYRRRFSTWKGAWHSGWTGRSSFYRSL
jgi:hypothetical protein